MKQKIKVNYKSVFKYPDHNETVQFNSTGKLIKEDKKDRFVFFYEGTKMEIVVSGEDVILYNGPSVLNLHLHRKVNNLYQTAYGMINLYTELVTLDYGRSLKLKYVLSDGQNVISEVYVLLGYKVIE